MLFSIIIPAYNEELLLPACLQSLQKQTLSKDEFEIIVIDNGSIDNTPSIAQEYGAQLFIDTQSNVSGLRNRGAQQAKGEILAFIDADCTALEDWLESAVYYFTEQSIVAWGSPPQVPNDANWLQKSWFNLRKKIESPIDVEWLESMNLFVRKCDFDVIGGFNESLITCEDVDFSYRLSEQGRIVSDNSIQVIHFGEAKTIKEFIKKEFWRGTSNYSGFFSHKFKLSELSSLLLPVYFTIILPSLLIMTIMMSEVIIKWVFLMVVIMPVILVWIKLMKKKLSVSELLTLQFLLHIYFIVRSVSAFNGLFKKGKI
jgi:glycosyltransferase involved in cell wall biosynthesis